jgi:hypothetical protein
MENRERNLLFLGFSKQEVVSRRQIVVRLMKYKYETGILRQYSQNQNQIGLLV